LWLKLRILKSVCDLPLIMMMPIAGNRAGRRRKAEDGIIVTPWSSFLVVLPLLLLFLSPPLCLSSPIVVNDNKSGDGGSDGLTPISPTFPTDDLCILPQELGFSGKIMLVEDCYTLYRYKGVPSINIYSYRGSNVFICCPDPVEDSVVFEGQFENDDEYDPEAGDYDYASLYPTYDEFVTSQSDDDDDGVTSSDPRCRRDPGTPCVDISRCSANDFNGDSPPLSCGWSQTTGEETFCCKGTSQPKLVKQTIPQKYGDYECEDLTPFCKDFFVKTPSSCRPSHESFDFMRRACMQTCNLCGDTKKGCRDEFEGCSRWRTNGHCIKHPEFMFFNCRESCGTCGFTSPRNPNTQVVNGRDYSNMRSENFFCGEGLSKEEVGLERKKRSKARRQKRQLSQEKKLYYYSVEAAFASGNIQCGSVIINDKFIVFAGHCDVAFNPESSSSKLKAIVIRDGTKFKEFIELRRVFTHPWFKFPSLYDDIAVGELGRRIVYDYGVYGDSPACFSDGTGSDSEAVARAKGPKGLEAEVQGYGYTETGRTSDVLISAKVRVMSNADCAASLHGNTTDDLLLQSRLASALKNGVNNQLICTEGIYNKTLDIYTGPCEGDSGGPLYINHGDTEGEDGGSSGQQRRRQTLEGIVSGGLGCGQNIPSWYTRVSSYRPWVDCVIAEARKGKPKLRIEQRCSQVAGEFDKANLI